MACPQCLRVAARKHATASYWTKAISPSIPRSFTTSATRSSNPVSSTVTSNATPRTQGNHPAATSTSAAQPFSAPSTPSPQNESADIKTRPQASSKTVTKSTVPAGTPLKGLNFMKNQPEPVALEDSEYPDWLWDVLNVEKRVETASQGDLFAKSKKQRRLAAKQARLEALQDPSKLAPKIPIYEQSIDLPAGDGTVEGALAAQRSREELNQAMRDQRRAKIKEQNMLKEMGAA